MSQQLGREAYLLVGRDDNEARRLDNNGLGFRV